MSINSAILTKLYRISSTLWKVTSLLYLATASRRTSVISCQFRINSSHGICPRVTCVEKWYLGLKGSYADSRLALTIDTAPHIPILIKLFFSTCSQMSFRSLRIRFRIWKILQDSLSSTHILLYSGFAHGSFTSL